MPQMRQLPQAPRLSESAAQPEEARVLQSEELSLSCADPLVALRLALANVLDRCIAIRQSLPTCGARALCPTRSKPARCHAITRPDGDPERATGQQHSITLSIATVC